MEIQRMSWLLLAGLNTVLGADKPAYFLLGGKLTLSSPTSETITDILWKHNDDKLAEWHQGKPLDLYGSFDGRTTLDQRTGQLEVTDMGEADEGVYSVEINWEVHDQRYVASAIEEVPQPSIWISTPDMDRCTLSCTGSATRAEPVDYSWRMGDGEWKRATKDVNITKNETAHIRRFTCRVNNPVSERESEPKDNPFFRARRSEAFRDRGWVCFSVFLLLLVVASIACWKKEKIKSRLCPGKRKTYTNGVSGEPPDKRCEEAARLNEA